MERYLCSVSARRLFSPVKLLDFLLTFRDWRVPFSLGFSVDSNIASTVSQPILCILNLILSNNENCWMDKHMELVYVVSVVI